MENKSKMITNSKIAHGDQLGAQMITLANLIYLSDINNQEIVFFDELKNFRRGYQFFDVFECKGISLLPVKNSLTKCIAKKIKRIDSSSWQENMKIAYFSKVKYFKDRILYEIIRRFHREFKMIKEYQSGVHCDQRLLNLNPFENYDVTDGLGTYQDWKKSEKEVVEKFTFKREVEDKGDEIFNKLDLKGLQPVGVHFRLADYVVMASLNLQIDYYVKALSKFDGNKNIFLVFSDEIEKVKKYKLFENKNVIYMDSQNDAATDMYLMTKCTAGNIIANSTFSFWGAYLNKSVEKKVVCPRNFVSEDAEVSYLNGNYYPESWIAL